MALRAILATAATLLAIGVSIAQEENPQRRAHWEDCRILVGTWRGTMDGLTFEELWSAPDGGIMVGAGKAYQGDRAFFFEYLRVTREGDSATYTAQPMGSKATAFPLIESTMNSVTFENPDHDFPRRIHYELSADRKSLTATLTGVERGEDKTTIIAMTRVEADSVSEEE